MTERARKVLLWIGVILLGLAALEQLPSMYMIASGLSEGAVKPDDVGYFQRKLAIEASLVVVYSACAIYLYRRLKRGPHELAKAHNK